MALKKYTNERREMTVKWGIVGCGTIADAQMAPAIDRAANAQLVCVMSRSLKKAELFAKKHSAKEYYTDLDEFLKNSETDVVYIATPPALHCRQTIRAAQFGKHILCEKPMATTVEDAEKMIKVCETSKVKLMIGFIMRFHSCHLKARDIIKGGFLGKIVLARAQFSYNYNSDSEPSWLVKPSLSGGGSLMDVGVHCLDLLNFLLGDKITETAGFADNIVFNFQVEDTGIIVIKFSGGAYGIIDCCFNIPCSKNVFEIYGSKGSLFGEYSIGQEPRGSLKVIIGDEQKELDIEHKNMYVAEVEHFSKCVEADHEPISTGREGLNNLKVILSAYESAKIKKYKRVN
jgi:predicted dehydrogenase